MATGPSSRPFVQVRVYARAEELAERARREGKPISVLAEELIDAGWDAIGDYAIAMPAPAVATVEEPPPRNAYRARVFAPPSRPR